MEKIETLFRRCVMSILLTLCCHGLAVGQSWPTRSVTFVSSTSSGSAADATARILAPRLSALWKQAVVVDNRTGAAGNIGVASVARANPDGYTVLFAPNTVTMVGALYKNLGWDIEQSFEHVILLARTVSVLVVNNDLPVKSAAELIALARRRPGELNYASPGVGTPQHLSGELFKQIEGLDVVHVPYKTLAAAVIDVAGGRAQFGFLSMTAISPLLKAGKLRGLASIGEQRHPTTPDVPTFREAGIERVQAGGWAGVFLPRGTPREVVDRMARDIGALLQTPEVQQEILRADLYPNTNGGQREFSALVKGDTERWRKVIADGKITAD